MRRPIVILAAVAVAAFVGACWTSSRQPAPTPAQETARCERNAAFDRMHLVGLQRDLRTPDGFSHLADGRAVFADEGCVFTLDPPGAS